MVQEFFHAMAEVHGKSCAFPSMVFRSEIAVQMWKPPNMTLIQVGWSLRSVQRYQRMFFLGIAFYNDMRSHLRDEGT